jgi:hypothetical protein
MFAVKAWWIAAFGFVGDVDEFAFGVVTPAVKHAQVHFLVAFGVAHDFGAAMGADIQKAVNLAVCVTGQEDGLPTNVDGEVVVGVGDLAFMQCIHPAAFDQVFQLQLK